MNPYKNLPDHCYWRRSVSSVPTHLFDPVTNVKFNIAETDKVATAGSCFAQHISRQLSGHGFCYFVPENGEGLPPQEQQVRGYGVYSARYGNLYTVRQLLQLLQEALGKRQPQEICWQRSDGRFVDALRPRIEPEGFATEAEVLQARAQHLDFVRQIISESDIFVFTLGLTEGCCLKSDGTAYPLAPGVVAGEYDPEKYELVNFTISEVCEDLTTAVELLRENNPAIRVILTVSPVPLIATHQDRNVLVSTTYSKSLLRVAAEEIARGREWIDYFPSYEIITGNYNKGRYFKEDLREASEAGVAHVMRLFLKHYAGIESSSKIVGSINEDVECDEEELARIRSSSGCCSK